MTKTPKRKPPADAQPGRSSAAITITHYIDVNGCNIFNDWWLNLKDYQAKAAIARRVERVVKGNFGDCKPLRDGVCELRIDVGPGYRVYYAKTGSTVILLLCGGDKRKQNSDIDRACGYWLNWKQRKNEEGKK